MDRSEYVKTEHRGIPLGEWIPLPEELEDGRAYVKLILYKTKKSYAVAVFDGYGKLMDNGVPTTRYTHPDREYRETFDEAITALEDKIEERGLKMTKGKA